jgi:hypothetical protein
MLFWVKFFLMYPQAFASKGFQRFLKISTFWFWLCQVRFTEAFGSAGFPLQTNQQFSEFVEGRLCALPYAI